VSQFTRDLRNASGYRSFVAVAKEFPAAAPAGIVADLFLEGCVAKQVGMKEHYGISIGMSVCGGGNMKCLARSYQFKHLPAAQQRIKVAGMVYIAVEAVGCEICDPYKWVECLLSGKPVEFVDGQYFIHKRIITVQNYTGME